MSKRRHSAKLPPFVPLIKATMTTPAWKALNYGARTVYASLRGQMRNDASNNGKVYRSERDIAQDIGGGSHSSIVKWLQELEHYGFSRKVADGFLGSDGRGIATRWRLTEYATPDGKAATRDFDKWDGTPFKFVPPRPGSKKKKQNPGPISGPGWSNNRTGSSIPSPSLPSLGASEWSAPVGSAVATERAPTSCCIDRPPHELAAGTATWTAKPRPPIRERSAGPGCAVAARS